MYLHGIETNFIDQSIKAFNAPQTATIALVGTAPTGPTNELVAVTDVRQARQIFGEQLDGFTIPYALKHIFDQGGARVIVINVFDPALHGVSVADEVVAVLDGRASLAFEPYTTVTLEPSGAGAAYVEGTDYTIDVYGNIRVLDGVTIPDGTNIAASYGYFDSTLVVDAEVVGVTSPSRTGLELLDNAQGQLALVPKIILVPELGQTDLVTSKMAERATKFGAIYLLDAPEGSTVATVVQGRGPTGTIPGFRTDDKNAYLLFPYATTRDSRARLVDRPLSVFAAGVFSRVDARAGDTGGVQKSPSNEVLTGVLGPAVEISASYGDFSADTNTLNEVGVATIFNSGARGNLLWGSRNGSAIPVTPNTAADVFISVQRVKNMIEASIQLSMIPYLDRPINRGLIDAITESANAYLRGQVTEGAILGGKVIYDPATTSAELQNGIIRFLVDFQPPSPAERLVFTLTLNPEYLGAITA